MPEYRKGEIRPPDATFTTELLEHSVHGAVDAPIPEDLAAELGQQRIRWGREREVRPIQEPGQLAGYLAKYSTKSTEQAGGLLHPIHAGAAERVNVSEHVRGYLRAAFTLHDMAQRVANQRGAQEATDEQPKRRDPRLAANAHKLGYGGHCLTKSRRWSTTFMALRRARERHVHQQLLARQGTPASQRQLVQLDPEQRIARFKFVGVGHLTAADAFLAAQAAAQAREQRRPACDELCDCHPSGKECR